MKQCVLYFLIVLTFLSIPACQADDEGMAHVAVEFQPYFDRFVDEGKKYGVDVDLDFLPISAHFIDFSSSNVVGSCVRRQDNDREINVSRDYWNLADDLQKEYVIFHELGHCYLHREHLENTFSDGTCRSLMASGTGSCIQNYTELTRSYYLNELFRN